MGNNMRYSYEEVRIAMDLLRQQETKLIGGRISELSSIYGSTRKLGKALNIDHAYLHRLKTGEKINPSKEVLRKLGLI